MRTAPLCVAAALVVACAPQRADDPVVARVGDEVLTIAQLLDQLPSGTSELEGDERRQFVERWIQQELLYQEALDRDLDRNARVQNLIKQARRDLLVAALLDSEFENRDVEITDDGISTYYYNNQEKFERAEDEVWA